MEIISRKAWGAKYAAGSGARSIPTSETWLHHTATKHLPVDAALLAEYAQMRVVEQIGQDRFGAGFSYNLAGFPSGRIYVGCGVRRVGSHTHKRNTRALGIVLVGNYEDNDVSPELRASLVDLLRYGHEQGWTDEAKIDGGHRDLKNTACPGTFAYRLIPWFNAEAAKPAGSLVTPDPAPQTATSPTTKGKPMLIVLEPKGHRQFLCDAGSAHHIGGDERGVWLEAGATYIGPNHPIETRRLILARRGVTDL